MLFPKQNFFFDFYNRDFINAARVLTVLAEKYWYTNRKIKKISIWFNILYQKFKNFL